MATLIKRKVRSSTLIEVLIAMVIIMVIFSAAMVVFGNIAQSTPNIKKFQAQRQMERLIDGVARDGYLQEKQLKIDSIEYRFVLHTQQSGPLSTIEVKAYQSGRYLGELRQLIKLDNEN